MAFNGEFGKKIQQAGQNTADKTKKNAEVVRLNSSIKNLEKEMAKSYEELGKSYYQKFAAKKEYDSDMASYFEAIGAQFVQLDDYRAQIRALKGFRKCLQCGQEISADAEFCNYCGAKQEKAAEPEPQSGRVCPSCGKALEDDEIFCTVCGTKAEIFL